MRYGTRTHCKRRWSVQGDRPVCKMKLGYDSAYLYVALCPFCGSLFAMFFSHLDKACFSEFLKGFKEHVSQRHPGGRILLVGDGATAHTSQNWVECHDVEWLRQPTACPEVNPVERFFQELRRHTANQVFASKEEIEQKIQRLVEEYLQDPEKIISLTLFPYIKSS